jgi:hypothetical protein
MPDPVLPTEIRPGLVLLLDPDVLLAHGAVPSIENRVKGMHFFVCTSVEDDGSTWTPTFSKFVPGRVSIPPTSKIGHPKWTTGESFFELSEVWTNVTAVAVAVAADAANDLSTQRQRNRVLRRSVPKAA